MSEPWQLEHITEQLWQLGQEGRMPNADEVLTLFTHVRETLKFIVDEVTELREEVIALKRKAGEE